MKHRVPALVIALGVLQVTASAPSFPAERWTPGAPFVLGGTVVTPEVVLQHGYVVIENGRIADVSDRRPDLPGVAIIDTDGILYPGLVDLHNHVPWNVLPRWHPPTLYSN